MELSAVLSNPPGVFLRLVDRYEGLRTESGIRPTAVRKQRQNHLGKDERAELVKRYVTGEKQAQLAKAFGIQRETVAHIVERAGVKRPWALTEAEQREAIGRHGEGWSAERIAKHLGRSPETVRKVLRF